jgi:hypothetical protein
MMSVILGGFGFVTVFFHLDPLFLLNTSSFSYYCNFAFFCLSMYCRTLLSEVIGNGS